MGAGFLSLEGFQWKHGLHRIGETIQGSTGDKMGCSCPFKSFQTCGVGLVHDL